MPYENGLLINVDGSLAVTTDAVGASAQYREGIASTDGEMHTVDATSGVPAGALYRHGIARSANGAVYTTTATPSSKLFSRGIAISADGAIHITTTDPASGIFSSGAEVDGNGAVYVVGATAPTVGSTELQFNDSANSMYIPLM